MHKEIIEKYKSIAPVPVIKIAQDLGIRIYRTKDLPESQSGLIKKEQDGSFSILVNDNHSNTRNRFTIAHEIAHFLLHKERIEEKYITSNRQPLYRDSQDNKEATNGKKMEAEANKMAAELLMPKENFIEIWKKSKTIEEVADKFKVSVAAAAIRGSGLLKETII